MTNIFLTLIATAVTIPIVVVTIEVLAALWPRRFVFTTPAQRPRVDVLIPAHDEEAVIGDTLASVSAQLRPGDRVAVVADNCSDRTAELARAAGAVVWERCDPVRRGKGFAVEFGRERLEPQRGDVAVIVDADCRLEPGTLDALAVAAAMGRPVQADYLMVCPAEPTPRDVVSQFAVLLKNRVRLRGTAALGGAAVLTGSGMAFPWDLFRRARLDCGNIVEDMRLSFDLLIAGDAPLYCGEACVVAPLPKQRNASLSQRTRWEHGHLQTLMRHVPRLFWEAIRQRRMILLGAAIDLAVPPLSLLLLLWSTAFGASVVAAFCGVGRLPLAILCVGGALLTVSTLVVFARFGEGVSLRTVLFGVPQYIVSKIPIYASYLYKRQRVWVRTDRDSDVRPHLGVAGKQHA